MKSLEKWLILRHTGMRFEDLAHLKAPDEHGRNGCLDQDSDVYWWICIDYTNTNSSICDTAANQQFASSLR